MELKTKQTLLEYKRKEIQFLRLGLLITLLLSFILATLLFYAFRHAQKIIVPAYFNQPVAISEATVSSSYLSDVSESLFFDRYNVTPENVQSLHNLLLSYVAGSSDKTAFYNEFSNVLNDEETAIKNQDITSAFYINAIDVDTHHLQVEISGTLRKFSGLIGSSATSLPDEDKKFLLSYQYTNGLLQLTNWSETK